jgi:formylglycine-generating enzyme required for sulfatase activity
VGFVRIEPGSFTMGSPGSEEGRDNDEAQHAVTLTRGFCLMATEVTQGQWRSVMGSNPSGFASCGASCPVEQVSWDDAVAYANRKSQAEGLQPCYEGSTFVGVGCTGYRLPTEAEWEYAARAGTTGARHGSLDAVAWHVGNSGGTTHPVGQKQANAWGLYDMLGNVWEWTSDWYGSYPGGAVTDPVGASTGSNRVLRGGSWYSHARLARAAYRNYGASVDNALVAAFGHPRNVPDGVELRSDHGSVYTGTDAHAFALRWGVEQTFAPVGRPSGNAAAERTIRTMKEECVWLAD